MGKSAGKRPKYTHTHTLLQRPSVWAMYVIPIKHTHTPTHTESHKQNLHSGLFYHRLRSDNLPAFTLPQPSGQRSQGSFLSSSSISFYINDMIDGLLSHTAHRPQKETVQITCKTKRYLEKRRERKPPLFNGFH